MDYTDKLEYVLKDYEGNLQEEQEMFEFMACKCYFYQRQNELMLELLNKTSKGFKDLSHSLLLVAKDGYNH